MAGFVPLQKASAFSAGVMGPGEGVALPSEAPPVPSTTAEESGLSADGEHDLGVMESVLPSTVEELESVLEEVRAEARVDAESALATIREELQAEKEQLVRLREKIDASRALWAEEVRNMLGELVVVGVRQVVSDSADLQTDMLRDRFAEVGERLIGEQNVIVRVRPEDEEAARALVGDRDGWQVVPDADLSGGIVAETDGGKVDATLGAALTGLTDAVQSWQGEGVGEE
jgi:flagellar biosynthesis/type III secretory pathway protein FliH